MAIDGTDRNNRPKQPIRTRYLGHVTGYQPIRDLHFLIRSSSSYSKAGFSIPLSAPAHFSPSPWCSVHATLDCSLSDVTGLDDVILLLSLDDDVILSLDEGTTSFLKCLCVRRCEMLRVRKMTLSTIRMIRALRRRFRLVSSNLPAVLSSSGGSEREREGLDRVLKGRKRGCRNRPTQIKNPLFRSCDWISANQGLVFPDSVGSWQVVVCYLTLNRLTGVVRISRRERWFYSFCSRTFLKPIKAEKPKKPKNPKFMI
eukprot:sb/3468551/